MITPQIPEIRPATIADYEGVCELFRQLDALHVELLPDNFRAFDGPARSVELFREKVNSPDKALFVALSSLKIVGFADVQKISAPPFPMFKPKDFALIDNVFVARELRGTGLAHLLFQRVKTWAQERGISALQLKVYNVNSGAIKFYEKEGMLPVSTTFELKL